MRLLRHAICLIFSTISLTYISPPTTTYWQLIDCWEKEKPEKTPETWITITYDVWFYTKNWICDLRQFSTGLRLRGELKSLLRYLYLRAHLEWSHFLDQNEGLSAFWQNSKQPIAGLVTILEYLLWAEKNYIPYDMKEERRRRYSHKALQRKVSLCCYCRWQ
jgi:hypothetical protein